MACTVGHVSSASLACSTRCQARRWTKYESAQPASMEMPPRRTLTSLRSARPDLRRILSNSTSATETPRGAAVTTAGTATAPVETSVETIVLPIQGMTCAACQAHVERSLRAAPGVLDATVNLLAHSARVMYEPAQSSLQDLVAVVGDAGYEATLPSQAGPDHNVPQR